MVSSGGGRKRGRPAIYTPEQKSKIERDRDRWKKAAKRKRDADAKWERSTNFGYIQTVEVLHGRQLVDYLVWKGLLTDIEDQTRIDEATDKLLAAHVDSMAAHHGFDSAVVTMERPLDGTQGIRPRPNPNFVGCSGDGVIKVRVRVTMNLVETLGLEHECHNRGMIRRALGELLFAIYSNIADRDLDNPWRTTGKHSEPPRPAMLTGPGAMYNERGPMEGRRR